MQTNHIEAINKISKTHGTPFYFYDLDLLRQTLNEVAEFIDSGKLAVHYALKANANDRILKEIQSNDFGADCVSGNEIKKALEIGFKPSEIVFAGVGKNDDEIQFAIEKEISRLNVESLQELEVINQISGQLHKKTNVALRINPNVDAKTHKYITTGLEENKFGINMSDLDRMVESIKKLNNIKLDGVHFHIGSQIQDLSRFRDLSERVNDLISYFEDNELSIDSINVGGGLGIDYKDPKTNVIAPFEEYFRIFKKHLSLKPHQSLHFELGRSIVAPSGVLVTKTLYTKSGLQKNFAIVDAGTTELIRPALYQAYHYIENVSSRSAFKEIYDVVGPICETSDFLGKDVELPETKRGDTLVVYSAGAYGEVMANNYNLRDTVKAFYSDDW